MRFVNFSMQREDSRRILTRVIVSPCLLLLAACTLFSLSHALALDPCTGQPLANDQDCVTKRECLAAENFPDCLSDILPVKVDKCLAGNENTKSDNCKTTAQEIICSYRTACDQNDTMTGCKASGVPAENTTFKAIDGGPCLVE